jgi:hypothetical protein
MGELHRARAGAGHRGTALPPQADTPHSAHRHRSRPFRLSTLLAWALDAVGTVLRAASSKVVETMRACRRRWQEYPHPAAVQIYV